SLAAVAARGGGRLGRSRAECIRAMMPASVPERVSPATLAVSATPSNDWDDFVRSQRGAAVYFQSGWVSLPRDVFGHQTFFIEARDASGRLVGVLPLVRQRSLL